MQAVPLILHAENFNNEYSLVVFDQLAAKLEEWKQLIPNNIFFSPAFLQLIEEIPPQGIKPFYAIISNPDKQVAILSMQMKEIDLAESMNMEDGFKSASLSLIHI